MNAPAAQRDFPDWLGPMLVKELRRGLKTRAFVISFIAIQAVFVYVIIYQALLYGQHRMTSSDDILTNVFWMLMGLQLLIITPCRAFNELAGERKANTLELTFMTGLTPWGITVGKWASLLFQALLFVLAVLPYAILRYYFGGVNLIEDLGVLGTMLVLCATFSALAIAISGLPLFVRILVMVLAFFFSTAMVPGLLFGGFGRSGFGSFFPIPDIHWTLLCFDAAVICLAALKIGAAAIAPQAENHASRQRLISFAALLPFVVLVAQKADRDLIAAQLVFFETVAGFTLWHQLAAAPSPLRRHFEPFARFGPAGFVLGAFFQPGWPGAALYLLAIIGVMLVGFTVLIPGVSADWMAALFIQGAAQLSAPLIWRVLRRRARWPLLEYVLFQVIFGLAAICLLNLKPYTFHYGKYPQWAAFPSLGMWLMLDNENTFNGAWLTASIWAFLGYFLCLQGLAIGYWRRSRVLFREVCRDRKVATAPAVEAADAVG